MGGCIKIFVFAMIKNLRLKIYVGKYILLVELLISLMKSAGMRLRCED